MAGRDTAPAAASDATDRLPTVALPAPAAALSKPWAGRWWLALAMLLALLSAGALTLAYDARQRAQSLEAELTRRQRESEQAAQEARVLARQSDAATREAVARMALLEARVAETAMQRSQIEELVQSVARSRDENVLADVEAALRVAQQHAALTGSADPVILVLRQSEERLARYNQPRLERVRRAVAQDLQRTRAAGGTDIPALTLRLDELVRQIDELPLLATPAQTVKRRSANNEAAAPAATAGAEAASASAPGARAADGASAGVLTWLDTLGQSWRRLTAQFWSETRALLRVTRIDAPEAMLIAPEQAWFLRENLKLRLLNARLALLSRQFDVAQSDLRESLSALERYFDRGARRTAVAADTLKQVMAQARTVPVPRPDATLAAIATAAAGR